MNVLSNPSLYIEGQSGCFYSKKYYILENDKIFSLKDRKFVDYVKGALDE